MFWPEHLQGMSTHFKGLLDLIESSERMNIEMDLDASLDNIYCLVHKLNAELNKLDDVLYRSLYGEGPKLFERRIDY